MTAAWAPVRRLLCACVRDEPGTRLAALAGACDPVAAAGAAEAHGVAGIAYRALEHGDGVPGALLDPLRSSYLRAAASHLRTMADLASAAEALSSSPSAWLVVKGPVFAERIYRDPGLRPYADLDLVVARAGFREALELLEAAGARVVDRNWRMLRTQMRGQVHVELRHGTVADVHWHLVNRGRDAYSIPMDELFDRSSPAVLGDVAVRLLDPVDRLLHVAVHAALAGADRLLWLSDIRRQVVAERPDWDTVLARAERWGVSTPVGVVLAKARRVVAADVPADVIAELLPGRARRTLVAAVDRFAPLRRPGRLGSVAQLPARTAGLGSRRAAAVLGRLVWKYGPALRGEPYGRRILRPRGGPDERDAYLTAVSGRV